MASWESLETIQSSHEVQVEINISFGSEDRKCLSRLLKAVVQNAYRLHPAKAINSWVAWIPQT